MKAHRLWLLLLLVPSACKKSDSGNSGNSPVSAPLDYIAAQGKAKKFAEKTVNLVEINSAIQKFQAMEDRYPKDFNELVSQHYLREAPVAPPGSQFVFDRSTGQVRLVRQDQIQPASSQAGLPPNAAAPRRGSGGIRVPQQGASPVEE